MALAATIIEGEFMIDVASKDENPTFVRAEAQRWLERLEQIEQADVAAILDQVPPDRMSSICRRFTPARIFHEFAR